MERLLARLFSLSLLLVPVACAAIDHNVPAASPVNGGAPADRLTLYADANGHLYPDGDWRSAFDPERIESRHALLASRNMDRNVHRDLIAARARQLDGLAQQLAGRSRVIVLVHGFNNNHSEARHAFDVVRSRLALGPDDGVVEFHWDGLSSLSDVGRGSMWFNAAGYSQLAGTQALRGLLDRLADRQIVIIAHSRGSSVTLSALSDPAYSPRFERRTRRFLEPANASDIRDFGSPPLREGSGAIEVLMLAPAIGNPDFWRPGRRRGSVDPCDDYRDFPRRLRSIRYSVNPEDPVLSKMFPRLASSFNATDLGYAESVGEALAVCYRSRSPAVEMKPYPLNMPHHSFIDYALRPEFAVMLADAGLTVVP